MDQVAEVKDKTDIVAIISERIKLSKAGRNYKGLCPFHGEKTPSFVVSPELQIYKCFGCGETGDVLSFLEKYEGLEFYEALKLLADKTGMTLKIAHRDHSEKDVFYEMNALAAKLYHHLLINHPSGRRALVYLTEKRGLVIDTINTFNLGYAPSQRNLLVNFLKKKKFSDKQISESGLVYSGQGSMGDRFRQRAIFPIYDTRSNVIALAGRLLPQYERSGVGKYVNSPETAIYHKSDSLYGINVTKPEIKKTGVAIVVEGEMDMLSSWQAGVKNVVAIKGSALTDGHVRVLSRVAKTLILALDSDFAGEVAAMKGLKIAQDAGLDVRVARLGKYKDPDEAARADKTAYKNSLQEASGVWDFVIDTVISRNDAKTGIGKGKVSRELVPLLAEIEDSIVRSHYAGELAKRLNVPVEAVATQISDFLSKRKVEVNMPAVEEKKEEKARREILEERFLSISFRLNPEKYLTKDIGEILKTPLVGRLYKEYVIFAKDYEFSLKSFSDNLPPELINGFNNIVLASEEDNVDLEDELKKLKYELQVLSVKEGLVASSTQISKLEAANDSKKLSDAEEEFTKLTRKLNMIEEERS